MRCAEDGVGRSKVVQMHLYRTWLTKESRKSWKRMPHACFRTVLGVYCWARVCARSWAACSSRAMPRTSRTREHWVPRFHKRRNNAASLRIPVYVLGGHEYAPRRGPHRGGGV